MSDQEPKQDDDRRTATHMPGALATLSDRVVLPVTWASLAAYLISRFDRRMIGHDEGLLGQSAERVLRGELPHRDFDEPYSGGLALLDALGFRAFGASLLTERLIVLGFALAFVGCVYALARRALPPWAAGLLSWLCIAFSVPNYFAGLPSWYNLFFAGFGTLSLLRFSETRQQRWLVLAGLCGGASIAIKSVGAYYVLASLLALVYFEQNRCEEAVAARASQGSGLTQLTHLTRGLVLLALCASCGVLFVLAAHGSSGAMDWLVFALPVSALALGLLVNDLRLARAGCGPSLAVLARNLGSYALGLAAPLIALGLWYAAHAGLGDLFYGLFVAPRARLQQAAYPLPPLSSLLASAPLAVVLASPLLGRAPRRFGYVPVLAIAAFFVWRGAALPVYGLTWYSLRPLVPTTCVVAACMLVSGAFRALPRTRRESTFVLCAMCGALSLVQFPYAFGVYFCYVAPLLGLAIASVVSAQPRGGAPVHCVYAAYYLLFALCWLNGGEVRSIGVAYRPDESRVPLALPRGGLLVSPLQARLYTQVVKQVQAHSAPGAYIYATPDCPEVYFLSERKNPSRVIYEALARDARAPASERRARVLATLEQHHVDVVVLAQQPEFSGPVEPTLLAELAARYPHETSIDPLFLVRWRDRSSDRMTE